MISDFNPQKHDRLNINHRRNLSVIAVIYEEVVK